MHGAAYKIGEHEFILEGDSKETLVRWKELEVKVPTDFLYMYLDIVLGLREAQKMQMELISELVAEARRGKGGSSGPSNNLPS